MHGSTPARLASPRPSSGRPPIRTCPSSGAGKARHRHRRQAVGLTRGGHPALLADVGKRRQLQRAQRRPLHRSNCPTGKRLNKPAADTPTDGRAALRGGRLARSCGQPARRLLVCRSRLVSVFDKRHREVIARVAVRSATARRRAVSEVVTQDARTPPRTYWVAAHRARIFCPGRQPLHRKYSHYTRGGNAATLPPGDALHNRSVVARLSVRPATRDISLPGAHPANSCRKHGEDIG